MSREPEASPRRTRAGRAARADEACRFVTRAVRRCAPQPSMHRPRRRPHRSPRGIELSAALELAAGTASCSSASRRDRPVRTRQAHASLTDNGTERGSRRPRGARIRARVDPGWAMACANVLLGHENSARAGRLGLWAEPVYVIGKGGRSRQASSRAAAGLAWSKARSSGRESGARLRGFGWRRRELHRLQSPKRMSARLPPQVGAEVAERLRVRIRGWIRNGRALGGGGASEQVEVMQRS